MDCLTDTKIQDYIEGNFNSVEKSIIRDHLIVCEKCNKRYEMYKNVERILAEPVLVEPPRSIERNVMRKVFPMLPVYSSMFTLIAASFVLLVTSIYVYFDFANNSIVQAVNLTSKDTSSWIGYVIKFVSTIFYAVYTVFKAINGFIKVIFNINLGAEIIGVIVLILFFTVFYKIYQVLFKKIKGNIQ